MFNKYPALRRAVHGISIILILIPLGIGLYQKVSRNRTLAPVKLAISIASESGLEYPKAKPVSEEMRARYQDEDFARELEKSLERLRLDFDEDDDHPPEIAYWLGAGLMASGNLGTARAAVDICRVHHPYDDTMWILDAILTVAEGNTDLARERLEVLVEMFPGNRLARRNLEKLPS